MTPLHRERVVRGPIASEHLVQLFDDAESLAETVAEFLYDGWKRDEALLVVAKPANWTRIAPRLDLNGCPVAKAIAGGRLVVLDAATTMATFVVNDRPMRALFFEHIGTLVQRLGTEHPSGVRIYGEMVELLAEQGNLFATEQLEALWNDLGQERSFTLLCGYSSGHFADARMAARLHAICKAHTRVQEKPTDLLGSWLLADRRSRYHTA